MDAKTAKRIRQTLEIDSGEAKGGLKGVKKRSVRSSSIPNTSGEVIAPVRTNDPQTNERLGIGRIYEILEGVCADSTHPRFLDAIKVLADLRQLRGAKEALSAEDVDPAAFVQMVARAAGTYRNVRPFLEEEVLPRLSVK